MFVCNESGTLYMANREAVGKKHFLVCGDHLLMNLMFGLAIKKSVDSDAEIVCLLDKERSARISGKEVNALIKDTFSRVIYGDIMKPLECIDALKLESRFDLTVNCTDISGAETLGILATKNCGELIFSNLINNYGTALFVTEALSKRIDVRIAEGYHEEYAKFDIHLISDITSAFETAKMWSAALPIDNDAHMEKATDDVELTTYRKSVAEDFVCESDAMLMVLNKILNVAKYDCNVLITGDTGVGKEKVAALIHKNCSRRMHPFIKVNCAAVSAHLLESEFFGYEKGAFTGASSSGKVGYIEAADNGVLFLDEIGELPFELQAKLLRVLQEGEFMRVGGTKSVQTNVRIISATNKNPDALVAEKIFRADLYYRLNVFPIRVPNLSERREEVPVLTKHFLAKYNVKFGSDKAMSDEAIRFLGKRNWAGNIRELENFVQRLIINVKNNRIELMDVIAASNSELALDTPNIGELRGEDAGVSGEPRLTDLVNLYESEIIKYALSKYGTTRKAAAALGVSQSQLMRKKNKSRQT